MNPCIIVDPPPLDAAIRTRGRRRTGLLTLFTLSGGDGDFAQGSAAASGSGSAGESGRGDVPELSGDARGDCIDSRARPLLWEMLQGDLMTDGWRSTEYATVDLCLSCKGCPSDCPVNVDMATYKAEFTHHHYARRPWARPLSHWSMGWLPQLSRLGFRGAWTGNRFARPPLTKRLGGIAPERDTRPSPSKTFTSWFARRAAPVQPGNRGAATPWPDSFTNYSCAAGGPRRRRRAGGRRKRGPYCPNDSVCCGLTWISTGQL